MTDLQFDEFMNVLKVMRASLVVLSLIAVYWTARKLRNDL